ncbi:Efflux pump periplasmic linker BepF [compost metagenome]
MQYRSIETGRAVDGLRVVKSGLAAGDVVIVNGLQRVRPGVTVAATRVDAAEPAAELRFALAQSNDFPIATDEAAAAVRNDVTVAD